MTMTETTNNTEDRTTTSIVIRTEQRDRLRSLAREQLDVHRATQQVVVQRLQEGTRVERRVVTAVGRA